MAEHHESRPYVEAIEKAVQDGDTTAALQAAMKLMEIAEAEANLAAAGTAIDSNLDKLDEIKGLHVVIAAADQLATYVENYIGPRNLPLRAYRDARMEVKLDGD